jgi:predicted metal-dependent peptidase
VVDVRLCLPKGGCFASKYKIHPDAPPLEAHHTAEWYYNRLLDDIKKLAEQGKLPMSSDGSGIQIPGLKDPGCGSCAHGECSGDKDGHPSETIEGVTESEQSQIAQECAERVRKSAERGRAPAGLVRWANMVLRPPAYDWRKEFRRAIRSMVGRAHGYDLQTFRKFHRDCAAANYNVIAPSTYQPEPLVGIVLDTSGSMGSMNPGEPLFEAICEVEGICKSIACSVELLDVDCNPDAKHIQTVNKAKGMRVQGGGGTDMAAGLEVFETRKNRKPDVVIVLTDGITPWPATRSRHFKEVVGLIGDCDPKTVPAWMKVVSIKKDGKKSSRP